MDEFSLEVTAGLLLISQFYWGTVGDRRGVGVGVDVVEEYLEPVASLLPPLRGGCSHPVPPPLFVIRDPAAALRC